jgi:hypothetical protein
MTFDQGFTVDFMTGDQLADAWVCWDDTGIWLSSNAHERSGEGYYGFRGFNDPLATIKDIILLPASSPD